MKNEIAIQCENIVVEFPLFDSVSRSVKAQMTGDVSKQRSFRALDGISLTINKGERVGLLGRNGAGKSTFLRALAGVFVPKSGSLRINSVTTSLFETGVGMDSDASGYENIPLLMASRGIALSKLDEVIADVEDFTELGAALSRPLRTYSSGMRLRIAFAVATFHAEGILLMDEVIGVGDRQFSQKSKERITKLMGQAGTLVLASHSPSLLKTHCDRGLVFDAGKLKFSGSIEEAIEQSSFASPSADH